MNDGINRRDLLKRTAYAGAAVTALPGLAAFLAACANGTGGGSGSSNGDRSGIKLAVVTHGQASDPFWSVVKNGVAQGAKDMGVQYTYDAPTKFDMVAMSQLIDTQVARKPDGLIVSIPDANALQKSITSAVSAGIPVVSINSGADVFDKFGILTHVGQTEEIAGRAGGTALGKAGVMKGLCVNQEQGNTALEQRFQGFKAGLQATSGGSATELVVDLNNPTDT